MKPRQRTTRFRHRLRTPWSVYTPIITWTIIVGYVVWALGMTLQPERFSRTPSYGDLIKLAPIQVWGCGYLLVAALLFAWRLSGSRSLGVFAHTVAFILTLWWFGAFILRWSTDGATTVVNIVSWGWALSFVIRSMGGLDERDDADDARVH